MPISGFPDPFIVCAFIDDDRICISLFHNKTLRHFHFIYSDSKKVILGEPVIMKMECTMKNFPYKIFPNNEEGEIYIFYRQGQAFTINTADPSIYQYERMTEMDLGQMYLINNKALIARSSSRILFFKIVKDPDSGDRKWTHYETINTRGNIYFIKGNVRIQVTTDDMIYFYFIDQKTFVPKLDNVMFNFMGCNQMMFGSKVRYGITYKSN